MRVDDIFGVSKLNMYTITIERIFLWMSAFILRFQY